jgi:glycosyltransferase involved in cell wall biosynthesis
VIDAHSDAMQSPWWTRPRWLYRALARSAAATIVTNEHFADKIERWGGNALVIRDIPTTYPEDGRYEFVAGTNIAVVSTFAEDEPISEVISAAVAMPDVTFHITGNPDRARPESISAAPSNVVFTGFIPDESYFALLRGADAVMCLTTRDHTMQRGACEALSLGRPIITSDWPLLRSYFHDGTLHIDNTSAGIQHAISTLRSNPTALTEGVRRLQTSQRFEWERRIDELAGMLGEPAQGRMDEEDA